MRRVVITGLGVIAPNGIGQQAFWESLAAGRSAVGPIRAFDPSGYPCMIAAEVTVVKNDQDDFGPEETPEATRRQTEDYPQPNC